MIDPTLAAIPAEMAAAVRPHIAAVTLDGYRRFLDAMVHYTRKSGERLRHAATHTPDGPARDLFAALAREEANHYLLAEADLDAFGERPRDHEPARVTAFHDAWMSARDPGHWLGSLYALERVGSFVGADVAPNLARLGLRRDQVRFVMVHLDVDEDHGARTAAACAAWPDLTAILAAARDAADFWVGLHVDALRE